jgi:hypothetical protein
MAHPGNAEIRKMAKGTLIDSFITTPYFLALQISSKSNKHLAEFSYCDRNSLSKIIEMVSGYSQYAPVAWSVSDQKPP